MADGPVRGPIDLYEEDVVLAPRRVAPGPPTGFLENQAAAATLQEVDNSNYLDLLADETFAPVIDALNAVRAKEGKTYWLKPSLGAKAGDGPRPVPGMPGLNAYGHVPQQVGREGVQEEIFAEIRERRKTDPGFMAGVPDTVEAFMAPALAKESAKRDAARGVAARGEGFGATLGGFTGSVATAMTDPINIMTLPLGGGGKTIAGVMAREAGINMVTEALSQPQAARNRAVLGEELSLEEAALNIAGAGVGGAVIGGAFAGLGKLSEKAIAQLTPIDKQLAQALADAEVDDISFLNQNVVRGILNSVDDDVLAEVMTVMRGGELSPVEQAAVSVITRQADVDAVNPYIGPAGADRHADALHDAIERTLRDLPPVDYDAAAVAGLPKNPIDLEGPSPLQGNERGVAQQIGDFDLARYKSRTRSAESGGNDRAKNPNSSARGRFQFTNGTWLATYRKVFGKTGESDASILAKANNGEVQERLMDRLTADNIAVLRRAGAAVTDGNVYLAHFLGADGAAKLLRAPSDTPVERLLSGDAIAANPSILPGKSASEVIAWAARKMGGRAASVSPSGAVDGGDSGAAILREQAAELRGVAAAMENLPPMASARFRPDDIDVDAGLMQFKAGGDADGVTDRLAGVTQWNGILSGRAIVFEGLDGRRLIADGHQRLGLAKRIARDDPAQNVAIDALVMREADGWDAQSVRTWAALKNIAEGSGSAVDAAKVIQSLGPENARRYLPPRSALVRDAEGLAVLGPDAFADVVNELVDPGHAAIVGRISRDPGEQKALVDLLISLQPETRSQADSIIRQGIAAGFTRETQTDMFGSLDVTASLFKERARVLERGISELKKLKSVHSTAAANKDILETSGDTRIDAEAAAKEVIDNATAIELVERLAFSSGPVKDAIDRAARDLADGGRIGDVTKRLVAELRTIDLAAAASGISRDVARPGADAFDGGLFDGPGRTSDAGQKDDPASAGSGDTGQPDRARESGIGGLERLDPAEIDPASNSWPSAEALERAGQTGFGFDDVAPAANAFDTPDSPGPKAQADSMDHDMRLLADSSAAAGELFNVDGVERSLGDLLDDFDRDAAAIEAVRKCL